MGCCREATVAGESGDLMAVADVEWSSWKDQLIWSEKQKAETSKST